MTDADGAVLDNPVWSSIAGAHRHLSDVHGGAGRYHHEVSPFGGLADARDPRGWADLDDLLGGHALALIIAPGDVGSGWDVVGSVEGVQMEGAGLEARADPDLETLTPDGIDEMLALIERARPGPFLRRTPEMGTYLGLRHEGALVAMAGERVRPTGWTEISAVCTDEAHRGRGLGTRLVRAVAAGIRARGDVPFLHAAASNVNAIRLYEALGFTVRRAVSFTSVRKHAG